jgi:hypothetical protein
MSQNDPRTEVINISFRSSTGRLFDHCQSVPEWASAASKSDSGDVMLILGGLRA